MAKKKQIKDIEVIAEIVVSAKDSCIAELKIIEGKLNSKPTDIKRNALLAIQTELQTTLKTL